MIGSKITTLGADIRVRSFMNNKHSIRAKNGGQPSNQHLLERYKQHLHSAEFKMSAGDRIGAENELQHAEHFLRAATEQKDPQ
jgi:hypothetical protein